MTVLDFGEVLMTRCPDCLRWHPDTEFGELFHDGQYHDDEPPREED